MKAESLWWPVVKGKLTRGRQPRWKLLGSQRQRQNPEMRSRAADRGPGADVGQATDRKKQESARLKFIWASRLNVQDNI